MAKVGKRVHKHYLLDQAKITRAMKVLGTKTETETIERALDLVIERAKAGLLRDVPENPTSQRRRSDSRNR